MSKSVIETLKELVKANGNQAAAVLDTVIEVLEQGGGGGGTVIPGEAGQFLMSDGEGGVAADDKVRIDEHERLNVSRGLVVSGSTGVQEFNAGEEAVFDGSFKVTKEDAVFGGKGFATGFVLYDTANPTVAYRVTIANGQLTATQMP